MDLTDFFVKGFTQTNDEEVFSPLEEILEQVEWEHRASKLNVIPADRIVANFGFYIEGL